MIARSFVAVVAAVSFSFSTFVAPATVDLEILKFICRSTRQGFEDEDEDENEDDHRTQ